jgi:hypothetical protein
MGTFILGKTIRKAVKSFIIMQTFPQKPQRRTQGKKHNVSRETLWLAYAALLKVRARTIALPKAARV